MFLRHFTRAVFIVLCLLCVSGKGMAQYVNLNDTFTLYYPTHGKNTVPKVFLKGAYKDSLPEGRWTYYHEMGSITEIHNYKKGLLNDSFSYYPNNSAQRAIGVYKNNLKNGTWVEAEKTSNYVNDTLEGWQHGPMEGLYRGFIEYIYFEKGMANGPYYLKASRTGSDTVIWGQYKNDLREGRWIIKKQGREGSTTVFNYKNNELEDTTYTFDADSVLSMKAVYRQGKKHGPEYAFGVRHWAGDEQIDNCRVITTYKNGEVHGTQLILSAVGDTLLFRTYVNGQKYGTEIKKGSKGNLLEKHWYYAGSSYDSCLKWNSAGILVRNYVVKSLSVGEPGEFHKSWDSTGRLTYSDTFYIKSGKRYMDIMNFRNGIIVNEKHYLEGKRYGRWYKKGGYEIYYDSSNWDKAIAGAPGRDEDVEVLHEFNIQYERAGSGTYAEGNTNMSHYPNDFSAPDRLKRNSNNENRGSGGDVINYKNIGMENQAIKDNKLHGKVVIKVYINKFGYATCPVFVISDKPELNAEALRLVLQTQWVPRREKGYIIPVWKEMTVVF